MNNNPWYIRHSYIMSLILAIILCLIGGEKFVESKFLPNITVGFSMICCIIIIIIYIIYYMNSHLYYMSSHRSPRMSRKIQIGLVIIFNVGLILIVCSGLIFFQKTEDSIISLAITIILGMIAIILGQFTHQIVDAIKNTANKTKKIVEEVENTANKTKKIVEEVENTANKTKEIVEEVKNTANNINKQGPKLQKDMDKMLKNMDILLCVCKPEFDISWTKFCRISWIRFFLLYRVLIGFVIGFAIGALIFSQTHSISDNKTASENNQIEIPQPQSTPDENTN